MTDYKLIRSKRKTAAIQIRGGEVIVRAPLRMPKRDIDALVVKHEDWIRKHLETSRRQLETASSVGKLSRSELDALYKTAKEHIPQRVRYYAGQLGVEYGRITIRCQRTRWGSCSSKKNLNFNCLLMLTPPEVIDSVVAHEVCHLKEMNHSERFYELVLRIFPDYHRCDKWLKDNGKTLLALVPESDAPQE